MKHRERKEKGIIEHSLGAFMCVGAKYRGRKRRWINDQVERHTQVDEQVRKRLEEVGGSFCSALHFCLEENIDEGNEGVSGQVEKYTQVDEQVRKERLKEVDPSAPLFAVVGSKI